MRRMDRLVLEFKAATLDFYELCDAFTGLPMGRLVRLSFFLWLQQRQS